MIDAEFGLQLEPSYGLEKFEDQADIPSVVQEEVVPNDSYIKNVVIVAPAAITRHPFRKKSNIKTMPPNNNKAEVMNSSEIFYEDDMIIGSTESIGTEIEMTDLISKNIAKHQAKVRAEKKIGNHRRKVSRNYEKGARGKDIRSPGRPRKDSGVSDDGVKSPKMQILLGSGQALPVSEGEQVVSYYFIILHSYKGKRVTFL